MSTANRPLVADSPATFGEMLKFLRRRERLTQLELSIAVGYSEAQISRLEKNQRLPDLTALRALFIPALHLEKDPDAAAHLLELAQSARQEDAPAPGMAPYKGLLFFDEPDAEWFYGREALTERLCARVNSLSVGGPLRLLAVVGASGSGKSSLVRAGVAVALRRAGWDVRVFTPTAEPFKSLNASTIPTNGHAPPRVVWLVDQFEEVFTLCRSEVTRAAFVEHLLAAANERGGSTTLVIALRADFYSHCAQFPRLREAIASQQEFIGQMSEEELRRAIEDPARRGGWEFEPGLVDILLRDVGAGGAQDQEPGALPLLSHALLATWERRRGRTLTLDGYRASGGVQSAIAQTAESVFADQLDQQQREYARNIFLRLTELGEGTEDTRRRAALTELVPDARAAAELRAVLNTLSDARLVILGEDSAEVAHEALIREWQRLREWLNQGRDGLRLHRHLTEAAREWQALQRDAGALYRGARLAQALEWSAANAKALNEQERAFLDASKQEAEREAAEREAQRQKELEAAQRLAEAERRRAETQWASNRKLRQRAVYLAGALAIAAVLAVAAIWLAGLSYQNEQSAITQRGIAETERLKAEDEKRIAFARELSVNAVNNLDTDPERSILLALQAVSVSSARGQPVLLEAEEALHRAMTASRVQFVLRHDTSVSAVAYSPDGTHIATGAMETVKVWDAATGKDLRTFPARSITRVLDISYSPDGSKLAIAGLDKTARVLDAATGKELLTLTGHSYEVAQVAFSPDGTRIATSAGAADAGSPDHTAKIWDATTGKELLSLVHPAGVNAFAYSPDGKRIATGGADNIVRIWDAVSGQELYSLAGHKSYIQAVAYSRDGKRVATGGGRNDGTLKIWDANSGQLLMSLVQDPAVKAVAFDSTGTRIASAGVGGKAHLWDLTTGKLILTLAGHNGTLPKVAISPDGTHLATASEDMTVRVWDISPAGSREWLTIPQSSGFALLGAAYSPDGTRIAGASIDKTVKIYDAQTGTLLLNLARHTDMLKGVGFSSDGKRLVTKSMDKTIKVWDALTGKELLTIPNDSNYDNLGLSVEFSPDGRQIASSGSKGATKIWDAATGKELLSIPAILDNYVLHSVRFSPDGQRIAGTNIPQKVRDARTGEQVLSFGLTSTVPYDLAFSPDGKRLAVGYSDGIERVFDPATGEELLTLSGHTSVIFGTAFSPDGKRLATASGDGTTKIWNLSPDRARNEQPLTLYGAYGLGVAFSPDGKRLVTAGIDGALHVYALSLDDLVAIAKSRVTRTLTTDECQRFLHGDKCP